MILFAKALGLQMDYGFSFGSFEEIALKYGVEERKCLNTQ